MAEPIISYLCKILIQKYLDSYEQLRKRRTKNFHSLARVYKKALFKLQMSYIPMMFQLSYMHVNVQSRSVHEIYFKVLMTVGSKVKMKYFEILSVIYSIISIDVDTFVIITYYPSKRKLFVLFQQKI